MPNSKQLDAKYRIPTFERNIKSLRGKNKQVWDRIDHYHSIVTAAICKQAQMPTHCSNLYYVPEQVKLASELSEVFCLDKISLDNSNTEANDAAMKLAIRAINNHEFMPFEQYFREKPWGPFSSVHKPEIRESFEALRRLVTRKAAKAVFEQIQRKSMSLSQPKNNFQKSVTRSNEYRQNWTGLRIDNTLQPNQMLSVSAEVLHPTFR
jgi:acetylornithine/succinyldiaminopimelate/putrescine aminotransferase